MSKVAKRKHVMIEATRGDFELPKENQSIVKVTKSRGNNLHEVTTPDGVDFLVSMPTKFRKNIWVKRGDFILIEPIAEGDKVKGEIVKIMNKDSIKYYKENNVWPKEFELNKKEEVQVDEEGLFVNTNRRPVVLEESASSDESSDDSDSSDNQSDSGK